MTVYLRGPFWAASEVRRSYPADASRKRKCLYELETRMGVDMTQGN